MDFTAPQKFTDGAAALDRALAVLRKYCVLPTTEAYYAVVLWIAATHVLPSLPAAPRLVVTSAVKRSGKTRVLDIVEGMVHDPLVTLNASTAAVFRSLDKDHPPTLIIDEVDTIFGTARMAEANEDLRGLINAGFQRGKSSLRCVGPQQTPTLFPTFAMCALAGIGGVPDTIRDRAVNIRMRRRKAGETVSPFRERRDRPALVEVRVALREWLADPDLQAKLLLAEPEMGLEDRAADVWEPLVMVADLAGGQWPSWARAAAKQLTAEGEDDEDDSESVRLLHDLYSIFHSTLKSDFAPTEVLLQNLRGLEESPWRDSDLNAHRVGALLKVFGIRSTRDSSGAKRGYRQASFVDAWARYPAVTDGDPDA